MKNLYLISILFFVSCGNQENEKITDAKDAENSSLKDKYIVLIGEGEMFFKSNKIDSAYNNFSLALSLDSTGIEALYGLGLCNSVFCYNEGKNCADAVIYLDKVISINPSYKKAYFNRSVCKTHIGDFFSALSDLDKAIELNPDDSDYYSNRGSIKLVLEDYLGACDDFKKAFDLGSKPVTSLIKQYCN